MFDGGTGKGKHLIESSEKHFVFELASCMKKQRHILVAASIRQGQCSDR